MLTSSSTVTLYLMLHCRNSYSNLCRAYTLSWMYVKASIYCLPAVLVLGGSLSLTSYVTCVLQATL